MAEALR